MSLLRARNYGVRVVLTYTSHISGIRSAIRAETPQKLELRLTDPRESEVPRVDGNEQGPRGARYPGPGAEPRGISSDGGGARAGQPARWPVGRYLAPKTVGTSST
jgi:S-DNA-T family DNA segregation ATPase FtsK/SpoIIIE